MKMPSLSDASETMWEHQAPGGVQCTRRRRCRRSLPSCVTSGPCVTCHGLHCNSRVRKPECPAARNASGEPSHICGVVAPCCTHLQRCTAAPSHRSGGLQDTVWSFRCKTVKMQPNVNLNWRVIASERGGIGGPGCCGRPDMVSRVGLETP